MTHVETRNKEDPWTLSILKKTPLKSIAWKFQNLPLWFWKRKLAYEAAEKCFNQIFSTDWG